MGDLDHRRRIAEPKPITTIRGRLMPLLLRTGFVHPRDTAAPGKNSASVLAASFIKNLGIFRARTGIREFQIFEPEPIYFEPMPLRGAIADSGNKQVTQFAPPASPSRLKPRPPPSCPNTAARVTLGLLGQGNLYQFAKKGDREAACPAALSPLLRSQPNSSANAASATGRTTPPVSSITAEASKRPRGPAGQYHNFRPSPRPPEPHRFCLLIPGPTLAPFAISPLWVCHFICPSNIIYYQFILICFHR
jgi:hypothetical protein